MSGTDLTKKGEERGRVKEQGRAQVCQKREVVEQRFKEVGEETSARQKQKGSAKQ